MSSQAWKIYQSVTASMTAVVTNTSLRKRLAAREGEPLPLCVVAPGKTGERVKKQTLGKVVVWEYPVLIGYVQASNGALLLTEPFLDTRETIRDALFSFGAVSVTGVYDFDLKTEAPDGDWSWPDSNFDACVFLAYFTSQEQRTS